MAFTKLEIMQAARSLTAEGKTPTFKAIEDALGGGTAAAISKTLSEFRNRDTNPDFREISSTNDAQEKKSG